MKKLFTILALSALSLSAFSQSISWAYLQWAASTTINQGQVFEAGAAVFADGVTNAAVASTTGEGITCELGYSSTNNDPSSTGWTWSSIPFNADWGNNFYFQGSVSGITAGTYYYTFRFKLGTDPYKYAGTNGLWNGTSSVNGSFTVNPAPSHVTWAYLQWAASTTINQGQSFDAGATVFADGLTNTAVASTTGEGMTCDLGYSSTNTDPSSTGWTWTSVPFNADWGSNFYFQGSVSGIPAGTYYYTFRFKLGADPYKYAGTNGLWDGTSSVNGSLVVTSPSAVNNPEVNHSSVTLCQNPIRNNMIVLNLNNSLSGKYKFVLIDNLGRLIQNFEISNDAETSNISIPLSKTTIGIYHLQVISPDNNKSMLKVLIE